jgi:hypothetical protein
MATEPAPQHMHAIRFHDGQWECGLCGEVISREWFVSGMGYVMAETGTTDEDLHQIRRALAEEGS